MDVAYTLAGAIKSRSVLQTARLFYNTRKWGEGTIAPGLPWRSLFLPSLFSVARARSQDAHLLA
eukprot:scaffold463_cov341-Pavlova_lutheri.AAC.6